MGESEVKMRVAFTVAALMTVSAASWAAEGAYNELLSVRNDFWDTTARTGVTVDQEVCEFADGLDVSSFDRQYSNEFDLDTSKRGGILIIR